MLFRPSFCANCGEKIERSDWGIFTSRRFCQVCETVYKGQDLLPRAVVGLGLIIGLFGIGGYLKSGNPISETQLVRQPRKLAEQAMPVAQAAPKDVTAAPAGTVNTVSNIPSAVTDAQTAGVAGKAEVRAKEPPKPPNPLAETAAAMYFCGAETKKGTPCRHRVKGNIRCFQHVGMSAMLQPDKLRIN